MSSHTSTETWNQSWCVNSRRYHTQQVTDWSLLSMCSSFFGFTFFCWRVTPVCLRESQMCMIKIFAGLLFHSRCLWCDLLFCVSPKQIIISMALWVVYDTEREKVCVSERRRERNIVRWSDRVLQCCETDSKLVPKTVCVNISNSSETDFSSLICLTWQSCACTW